MKPSIETGIALNRVKAGWNGVGAIATLAWALFGSAGIALAQAQASPSDPVEVEEDVDAEEDDGDGDEVGQPEAKSGDNSNVPAGSLPAADTSRVDAMAANEQDEEDDEDDQGFDDWASAPQLDFLLPVDGDIFYTSDIHLLINVQGLEPAGMVLVLDGYNYDQPLSLEAGLIRTSISGLHNGVHELRMLLLDPANKIIAQGEVRFFIRVPEPKRVENSGPVRQFGRVAARVDLKGAEARNRVRSQSELKFENGELVSGKKEKPLAQQVDGALEGAYNLKVYDWEAHGKVLLRTDEDRFRQPSHRFSTRIKYGPYAYVKAGDVYPVFNELLLSGARLRGGEAGMAIIANDITWGTLKVARGENRREIPAYVAVYDTGNGTRTDTVPGTYAQNLTAMRLGFGGGRTFELGVTAMMAEDKAGSQENLALADTLRGLRPLQNAVTGLDMRIGLWDGRIQIFSDAALSLLTRDKSLGSTAGDSIDLDFDPKEYEDFFIFNPTTVGLQHLIANDQNESDVLGFLKANAAWDVGINASIRVGGMVTESEVRYDHLGLLYHTEGNPFLGSDPGDGIRFLQKFLLFENRLSMGVEAAMFNQDLGLSKQQERTYKAEVRWTPEVTRPAGWVSFSRTARAPEGDYPYQYHSGFLSVNTGAYQQFVLPLGRLHASTLYGFTQSEFELSASDLLDSTVSALLDFPQTRTHIANVSFQLRPRAIDFMPRIAYTFSNNGVQEPTHNVAMGFQQLLLNGKVKGDVGVQIGQYPETLEKNDLMLGETFSLEIRFTPTQTARFVERWLQYGERRNVSVGGYYELYF
jgi:hypothetical protein